MTFFLSACNGNTGDKNMPVTDPLPAVAKGPSFFPVTSYIKGQIYDINQRHINPLKYIIVNGHTDSTWLKPEEFDAAFAEFLTPVIDSTNLINIFTENNFTDLSYDSAFTFVYEPKVPLSDTFTLRSWVVYVEPIKSNVKRIYMVKYKNNKEMKLTWQSDRWCSIITVVTGTNGKSVIEKEEKIIWDF